MSFRITGGLLIVLIVLGGVVLWVNRQGGPATDTNAMPTPAPLTSLSTSDVESIKVEQGDKSITVERKDDGWVIAGESPEPAGESKVTQAINRLMELRPTRTLEDVQNFGDFGLMKPAWIITLKPKEGKAVIFHVGDENPRSTARYLRVTGSPVVYLVSKVAVEDVQKWLEQPPYPPTPTPEPTETPAETPAPTKVPAATATP